MTASAAEHTLIAFRGRAQVRVIGEPTEGVPSWRAYTSLDDGAELYVSNSWMSDRNATEYRDRLLPDDLRLVAWDRIGSDDDPQLQAATSWLLSTTFCAVPS
jgi:hypothetical protein